MFEKGPCAVKQSDAATPDQPVTEHASPPPRKPPSQLAPAEVHVEYWKEKARLAIDAFYAAASELVALRAMLKEAREEVVDRSLRARIDAALAKMTP